MILCDVHSLPYPITLPLYGFAQACAICSLLQLLIAGSFHFNKRSQCCWTASFTNFLVPLAPAPSYARRKEFFHICCKYSERSADYRCLTTNATLWAHNSNETRKLRSWKRNLNKYRCSSAPPDSIEQYETLYISPTPIAAKIYLIREERPQMTLKISF